jgi:hypothetical protein
MGKRARHVFSSPPSSAPPSSSSHLSACASWKDIARHSLSAGLASWVAYLAGKHLPRTLALIEIPSGGVSHDLWAWLPFLANLASLVAIAAPVSFRSLLDTVASVVRLCSPSDKS